MDNQVLTSALNKIRGGEGVSVESLSSEEVESLSAFLSVKLTGQPLSEAEQVLCRHIRVTLQERAALDRRAEGPAYQRSNINLRAAIDLFMSKDYGAVLPRDVALLRETQDRLKSMVAAGENSPNQTRLMQLVGECLVAYDGWRVAGQGGEAPQDPGSVSPTPEVTEGAEAAPVSPVESVAMPVEVDAREFLAGAGNRESITAIDGIPVSASVRSITAEGAHALTGDITDEFLVEVTGGGLSVSGFHSGYIVADGDIAIAGNVQGGWIYSRQGSIRVDRILAGAVLIAPHGSVSAGSAESPRLLFCGEDFHVEQGVRGGTYFTRDFNAAETIRNARIHLRGSLSAREIEVDANDETAGLYFRTVQSCEDFGRSIPDCQAPLIRNFARLRYRLRLARALFRYLEAELLGLQRLRMFAVQSGAVDGSPLIPIRSAQSEGAILSLSVEIGEGLKELLAMGENLGHGLDGALVSVGVEETVGCLSTLGRELKLAVRGPVRDRECLEAPSRHIASFAKKLKDAVRLGQGTDKLIFDFDFRMDEWRAHARQVAGELAAQEETVAQLLGPTVWQVHDPTRLGPVASRMIRSAEEGGKLPRFMQSREAVALREHAEQLKGSHSAWHGHVEKGAQEYRQALAALGESIALATSTGGVQHIRAERIGPGLRLQTLMCVRKGSGQEGAMMMATTTESGSGGFLRMENLRIYTD